MGQDLIDFIATIWSDFKNLDQKSWFEYNFKQNLAQGWSNCTSLECTWIVWNNTQINITFAKVLL